MEDINEGGNNTVTKISREIRCMNVITLEQEIKLWKNKLKQATSEKSKTESAKNQIEETLKSLKSETEDLRSKIYSKQKESEDLEDVHKLELKVYEQKIIDIQTNPPQQPEEKEETLDLQQQEITSNIDILKARHSEQLKVLERTHQEKLDALKENLELNFKLEIHEMENSKNRIRNEMVKKFKKASEAVRVYYINTTKTNKDKAEELKKDKINYERKLQRHKYDINKQRERIQKRKDEIEDLTHEINKLQANLMNYQPEKASLFSSKHTVKTLLDKQNLIKAEYNEKKKLYNTALEERNEVYSYYEKAISLLKQHVDTKNIGLSKILDGNQEKVGIQEQKLIDILQRSRVSPELVSEFQKCLKGSTREDVVQNMRKSYADAVSSYNQALTFYEEKITDRGFPSHSLGYRPVEARSYYF